MEYFAEASEAYFGTNDFYPYVRSELAEHDPALFELLGKFWMDVGEAKERAAKVRAENPVEKPANDQQPTTDEKQ